MQFMQQRLVNVVGQGTLPERIRLLTEDVLGHIEIRYHCHSGDSTLPERIREVRRRILDRFEAIKNVDARFGRTGTAR